MNAIYLKYLRMIRNIHAVTKETLCIKPEEVPSLVSLAQRHFTSPFLFSYMESYPEAVPALKQQSKMIMYQYYQIEHFTELTISLMNSLLSVKRDQPCCLLPDSGIPQTR